MCLLEESPQTITFDDRKARGGGVELPPWLVTQKEGGGGDWAGVTKKKTKYKSVS